VLVFVDSGNKWFTGEEEDEECAQKNSDMDEDSEPLVKHFRR